MATSALRNSVDESVSFLDPGFTGVKNDLLKTIYSDPATPPKLKLLLLIARYSTGYLQPQAMLSEGFILRESQMSESSLYRAKVDLVNSGLITIRRSKLGRCIYYLVPEYQALKGDRKLQPSPARYPTPVTLDSPHVPKENKENDHQHQPQSQLGNDDEISINSSLTSSSWRDADDPEERATAVAAQETATLEEPAPDQAVPIAQAPVNVPPAAATEHQAQAVEPKASSSLTRKLVDIGVNQFLARRLTQTHSEELIEAALARVSTNGAITNPAGYLVAELSRGGYQAPLAPLQVAKDRAMETHVMRTRERENADLEREASNRAKVQTPLEIFSELPSDERDQLLRRLEEQATTEGFTKLTGWSNEHPVARGLLAELVRVHLLE